MPSALNHFTGLNLVPLRCLTFLILPEQNKIQVAHVDGHTLECKGKKCHLWAVTDIVITYLTVGNCMHYPIPTQYWSQC